MRRITYGLCTILRKTGDLVVWEHTIGKSHEALIISHARPGGGWIDESLQGLPKNLNLILSPHHIRFFVLFCFLAAVRSCRG